ncbi:uncharacterized protein LOC106523035 [Austrofundulus limnaeus]|uniref:Uncharacterized protein LOC106523035 n=1 Tax=Austrofundulus limnaeus TaxID=52670 RepID=A0A2I4BVJ3_AUSLI|nr:PREDICTED: uncharacterized protein LOC106523035 [Austrofundulus limnaeus]
MNGFRLQSRVRFKRRTARHCFVPFCSSSSRHNPTLSFHSFPSDSVLRAQWVAKIHRGNFTQSKHARVCGRHFLPGDFAVTAEGQTKLHKGAVPVLFQWNHYKRPEPRSVRSPAPAVADHDYCWTQSVALGADELVTENDVLQHTIRELEVQLVQLQNQNRSHVSIRPLAGVSDEEVRFYTRFSSFKHFEVFWRLVEPDVKTKMERITGAETTLLPVDELLLFLMFLSLGLPPRDLAERFGVPGAAARRIIETWAHFLYTVLGSNRLWVPPEVVRAHLPAEFSAFPDTQAVLSYVSVSCRAPLPDTAELPDASRLKALVGVAPHGAVTFVSQLYAASTSDRWIFKHCGVARLLGPDVAIMADEGFLADAPCKVYRPAMSSKAYVERSLRWVRENRLFSGDAPLPVCLSVHELFSVACFLLNYQRGLLGTS